MLTPPNTLLQLGDRDRIALHRHLGLAIDLHAVRGVEVVKMPLHKSHHEPEVSGPSPTTIIDGPWMSSVVAAASNW